MWDEGLIEWDTDPQQPELAGREGANRIADDQPPPVVDFTEDSMDPGLSTVKESKY